MKSEIFHILSTIFTDKKPPFIFLPAAFLWQIDVNISMEMPLIFLLGAKVLYSKHVHFISATQPAQIQPSLLLRKSGRTKRVEFKLVILRPFVVTLIMWHHN